MDAAIEITTDIEPGHLDQARILLGDVELGRFEGRSTVRFDVAPGHHVVVVKDGFGMTAATKFMVQRGHCASVRLTQRDPEGWGLVFGGFHVLRRAGDARIEADAGG